MSSSGESPTRKPTTAEQLARSSLIGQSEAFQRTVRLIHRVATCDATTLIEGETGTGKEVTARAIHYLGARSQCPFIPVNCGALPDGLLESELFGHERGAFTDAKLQRPGLVAQAEGGTLFLDEVETMSPRAQVVLLRFLQDQKYRPVGGRSVATANLRVIAASNAALVELADRGVFRHDLLFRLRILEIRLPPLRERPGDALLLARSFLERLSRVHQRPAKTLHPDTLAWFESYSWPGNVREVESLILREFLLGDGDEIRIHDARGPGERPPDTSSGEEEVLTSRGFREAKARAVAAFERSYLCQLLARAGGNISLAARISGKDRSALNRLVRKYRLAAEDFRAVATPGHPGVACRADGVAPGGTAASQWDELAPVRSQA
jgi:DNA-binding NtrC family response regulator